jgi:nucleoside-diphosphate-sugar epimerase
MRILVAGGAGYVGSKLVPALLEDGYEVVVLDLYLYKKDVFSEFKNNPNLIEIRGDIRNIEIVKQALHSCDAVIHLACISNDPSFELDPELGKSINLDSFEPFVKAAKKENISRFIYASSSSVYGVKKEANIHEMIQLEPLTDYSKFKVECENILMSYADDDFICTVVRPATVCGFAPRQRLDVVVNILTNLAYNTGKIKVMGGDQMRPNIHIDDMVRSYLHILKCHKEKIQKETFNVGYHNHTVREIAEIVKNVVCKKRDVILEVVESNDPRSYHISSDKIAQKIDFFPKYSIEDAVISLVEAFEKKYLPESLTNETYFNIKTMQKIGLK